MIKILYAGDGSIRAETEIKGGEVITYVSRIMDAAVYLRKTLEKNPEISVTHMPPMVAFSEFPKRAEDLTNNYDVLILSDIGYETLVLSPGGVKSEPLTITPNRLKEIKKYVEKGGGLAYCGGYFTFQGRYGRGNWYGTPVAEILPVEILPLPDDRVESPEGVKPEIIEENHPVMKGIEWNTCPEFFGYNRCGKVKEGGILLGKIGGDPFIVVGKYGEGRVLVFSSDPVLHWGANFVEWQYYSNFWNQTVRWLAKKD
ncbi:MAG: glutamine amidotransferase [bacterium]